MNCTRNEVITNSSIISTASMSISPISGLVPRSSIVLFRPTLPGSSRPLRYVATDKGFISYLLYSGFHLTNLLSHVKLHDSVDD